MGHHHEIDHKQLENSSLVALLLNLFFVVVEIIGGIFTNSIAIISDAIHDLGDVITLLVSFILIKLSKKKRTKQYTFGYDSLIIIGALVNTIILLSSSIYVFVQAMQRINSPEEVRGGIMFIIAVFGVLINGISVYKMSSQNNVMGRSLTLHLLEDALGWVAVLISSIFIYFFNLYILDTILSIVIASIIFFNAAKNIIKIINILSYKVPKDINVDKIQHDLCKVKGVLEVHDIHIWSLNGETNFYTSHVLVDENTTLDESQLIKEEVKERLDKYNIESSTIEIETYKRQNHEERIF